MNTMVGCAGDGASQPKEPVRLIDANELLKHFNTYDCAFDGDEFQAYKNCMMYVRNLVDDTPIIDPETLRSAEKCDVCGGCIKMTQLQEAIRDKITKYSDACGMCTDTTKECDTCGITCVLEDLNELQKLANNPESLRPTAHWIKCDLVKVEHGECTRHPLYSIF